MEISLPGIEHRGARARGQIEHTQLGPTLAGSHPHDRRQELLERGGWGHVGKLVRGPRPLSFTWISDLPEGDLRGVRFNQCADRCFQDSLPPYVFRVRGAFVPTRSPMVSALGR